MYFYTHSQTYTYTRGRKQKVAAERERISPESTLGQRNGLGKTEFIYLDNIPAGVRVASRKERKEAEARAINKTSPPQIFAVHAKKQAAHTQGALFALFRIRRLETVDKISNNKTRNGLITVACAASPLWGTK